MTSLLAKRSIRSLGVNLRHARLARRFSIADLASRAGVSPKTVQRLEKGDAGVGVGNLAAVLVALGAGEALADILRLENDAVALARAVDRLPKRGRSFGVRRTTPPATARHEGEDDDDEEGAGF
jgi:transcriptional regulator with XRE-family HTH domain